MNIPNSRSIPIEFFHQMLEYREEKVDGVLQGNVYWKYREDVPNWWNTKYADKKAGTINSTGYYIMNIKYNQNKCRLQLHTVVWILNHNCYPEDMLDHKDHDKLNNLIENLRPADAYLNVLNSAPRKNVSSQYKGVSYTKDNRHISKWLVQCSSGGKKYFGRYFMDELDAALAYNQEISKIHNPEYVYMNDISMGYTNKAYPNMPRYWVPEKVAA